MDWSAILHSSAMRGALSGIVAAAAVDLHAFAAFKNINEFVRYSWSLAAFRWAQGAVLGAVTGFGYGGLLS